MVVFIYLRTSISVEFSSSKLNPETDFSFRRNDINDCVDSIVSRSCLDDYIRDTKETNHCEERTKRT